jgi:hypothetical protein
MPLQILSRAYTNQVGSAATNSIEELQKKDRSADVYYTDVVNRLVKESTMLVDVVGFIRKSDFTNLLIEKDDVFDRVFRCLKQFVLASTLVLDDAMARKAYKIWSLFEAHDINLNRLGYEQQLFLTDSLLKELAKADNKVITTELVGVSDQLAVLAVCHHELADMFQQSKEAEAAKSNFIAPSVQRDVVRDIMNKELLPYLEVMSVAKPDMYAESFDLITEFITSINTKVRARITRGENQNQEELLEESN